jgi:antitoxin CcdA
MQSLFDSQAPRKATNLSINSDLLRAAKAQGINLSATLEQALIQQLRHEQQAQWLDENRESIANYNAHVEKCGVFSDGQRSF